MTRKALDGQAAATMVALCLIWGMQQVVIKMAAPDIAPLLQAALRSGISALLVGLLMWRHGEGLQIAEGNWKPGLLIGLLFAGEFFFIAEGLRFTTASHMAVFLYTAPMFAALGLHLLLPAERLSPLKWAGIALAFAGVALTFFGRSPQGLATAQAPNMLLGDLFGLLAGAAWGATTVVVRASRLSEAPAAQTLFWQLAIAVLLLLPMAALFGQTQFRVSALSLGALAFQGVVVSFVSYLIWFRLLRRYLASRLGVLSLMTPLFGIAFGVLLLGEPIDASFILGAVLVLGGILLVNGHEWLRQMLGRVKG
ncbi:MAG: DMT family transporter [Solimonas sp.]